MAVEDYQAELMEKFLVLKHEKRLTQEQINEFDAAFSEFDNVYEDDNSSADDCSTELDYISELIDPVYDTHFPDGHSDELSEIVHGRSQEE